MIVKGILYFPYYCATIFYNYSLIERSGKNMISSYTSSVHKNPSRKACEQIIERILTREFEEYGTNHHFKQASDFMVYFESLHPASPSLTKQVQRAVSAMNLPRDENGYFIINKTAEEYQAERELIHLLHDSSFMNLQACTPILLKTDSWQREHIMYLMGSISELKKLYVTLTEAENGILIYSKTPDELTSYLSNFLKVDSEIEIEADFEINISKKTDN